MTQKDLLFRQFQIRKFNRKRMIPAVNMTIRVNADKMLDLKDKINAGNGKNLHVTITHIILKAVAGVLVNYPSLYSFFDGKQVVQNEELVLNIPVDVESHVEYIVIHHPDSKSLEDIAKECRQEIDRIRSGNGSYMAFIMFMTHMPLFTKLGYLFNHNKVYSFMKENYGNFPISNFGSFHVHSGNVTLTQPMIGGMCIGSVTSEAGHNYFTLTLTFDHRAVDGAYGGKFLNDVKTVLECPESPIDHFRKIIGFNEHTL